MNQLYVSDIDGTLLDSRGNLTKQWYLAEGEAADMSHVTATAEGGFLISWTKKVADKTVQTGARMHTQLRAIDGAGTEQWSLRFPDLVDLHVSEISDNSIVADVGLDYPNAVDPMTGAVLFRYTVPLLMSLDAHQVQTRRDLGRPLQTLPVTTFTSAPSDLSLVVRPTTEISGRPVEALVESR